MQVFLCRSIKMRAARERPAGRGDNGWLAKYHGFARIVTFRANFCATPLAFRVILTVWVGKWGFTGDEKLYCHKP